MTMQMMAIDDVHNFDNKSKPKYISTMVKEDTKVKMTMIVVLYDPDDDETITARTMTIIMTKQKQHYDTKTIHKQQ